jgi:neutral ceramidase
MLLKKFLRYFLFIVLSIIGLILIFLATAIAPVDRSLPLEHPYYQAMLESIKPQTTVARGNFSVGFAKENITPNHPTALAGYGNRRGKVFDVVRDSIWVRTMVIATAETKVAVVTADLLLIPPIVQERLSKELPEINFSIENTYLGATHTHNSIGNWQKGAASLLYGAYDETLVTFIVNKIKRSIENAARQTQPATLKYGQIPVGLPVKNRLIDHGPVDSLLRVIEVTQANGQKGLLMSYTAHPTCLYSRDMNLSRDYPGKLVDEVESSGYAFAMFMAGSVGSHGCNPPEYGPSCIDWMAAHVAGKIKQTNTWLAPVQDSTLLMYRVPLQLGTAQVKISRNWRVRQWLFHRAFGEYPSYLSALRIGNVIMLSTPCDFSGEFNPAIDSVAAAAGNHVMVTSFNGSYIGYVTPRQYYDVDHYETQLMNWYGPGTGEYLVACLGRMIQAVDY